MKKWSGILSLFLMLTLVLSACSGGNQAANQPANNTPSGEVAVTTPEGQESPPSEEEPVVKDISGEITVWVFNEKVFEEAAAAFNKEYPNIKVNTVVVPFDELHNKLQTTLAAGTGAPDVAEIEQGQFPRYVTGNVLEDLLQEPYNADQYQDDISDYNWERWKSPDGTQLLGMPWDVTPAVYYYRADIFEELGLPSDPEELGEYILDGENFLNIAQKLKANGKFAFEWRDGPIHWAGDSIGYFDDGLNWLRNKEEFVQILDYTKRGNQLGWAPHEAYGSDKGKQLIKSGQLVGLVLGSWGARDIEATFPELKGKWRVTNLPFGINYGLGGSSFAIPSQSKNKEAAWAYVEWSMRSENAWKVWTNHSIEPGWKSMAALDWYATQPNEYLGGQQPYILYESLTDSIPVRRLTPVDGKAWGIWLEGILKALDKNVDSKTTLQQIADAADKQLKPDLDKLRKDMGK